MPWELELKPQLLGGFGEGQQCGAGRALNPELLPQVAGPQGLVFFICPMAPTEGPGLCGQMS